MSILHIWKSFTTWFDSRSQARVDAWLSESVDIADLQQRQQYLEQRSHTPWL